MTFLAGLLSWVLIIGSGAYIVANVVLAVKKIVAGRKARAGEDKNNDEREVDQKQ